MYYFDPAFGYIHVTGNAGPVRYGRGPVVPHDPSSITNQRYTRFEGWVEIQPHYVPDEWLLAFRHESIIEPQEVVVDVRIAPPRIPTLNRWVVLTTLIVYIYWNFVL